MTNLNCTESWVLFLKRFLQSTGLCLLNPLWLLSVHIMAYHPNSVCSNLEHLVKVNLSICSAHLYMLFVITITSQVGMSSNVCETVFWIMISICGFCLFSLIFLKNTSTSDRAARANMAALSSASDVCAGPQFPNLWCSLLCVFLMWVN